MQPSVDYIMSSTSTNPPSTNKGASAKAKSSKSKYLSNAEWAARQKEKEQKIVDAVNEKLAQLNRPLVTMKLHRPNFKGTTRPDYVSHVIFLLCWCLMLFICSDGRYPILLTRYIILCV